MKIAVIGASGKVGSMIVDEAIHRGHDVSAFVREGSQSKVKNDRAEIVVREVLDISSKDLNDFDVVVNALNAAPGHEKFHVTALRHLSNCVSGRDIRLMVVGGAGSLYVDKDKSLQLYQTDGFPEAFLPTATMMSKSLDELRKRDDIRWTYISPAANFIYDGEKTGHYTLAKEILTPNSKGDSVISYADYTLGFVDEIENGKHIKERISLVSQ